MKEFVKDFCEYMISKYRKITFGIDTVKFELISRYGKKSLMYEFIARKWLKQFFDLMNMLSYGSYNPASMTLTLNSNNDDIVIWLEKYRENHEINRKV